MGRFLQVACAAGLAVAVGCGESRPPSSSPPPANGGQGITGRERVGWTQAAASQGDLALLRYALYVDGTRHVLSGQTCAATTAGTTSDCSAPLPSMTPGVHTLELAAFVMSGDEVVESPRSAPLQVTVTALTAGAAGPAGGGTPEGGTIVSSDGLRFRADVILRDLTDPVDIAASNDGRVFVAERGGVVRIVDQAATSGGTQQNVIEAVAAESAPRLLSIALAPDFQTTGLLHVAYSGAHRDGAVLRVVRFRETRGVLGQAAVVSSHRVPHDAQAIVRSGPDGRLYVGVGTGEDDATAQTLAAAAGKVLRINADGSTPDDNPWGSPIFSVGHSAPRALVWHSALGLLLELEPGADGDEVNALRAGANYGWPLTGRAADDARLTRPALVLPPDTNASGAAAFADIASPLSGDLIVSGSGAQDLLRIRVNAQGRMSAASRLLDGRFGRIAQVTTASNGAIYFVTDNGETWGEGRDVLVRLELQTRISR